jgi:hypothetical protein
MVPGKTAVIVPSSSIAFSEFILSILPMSILRKIAGREGLFEAGDHIRMLSAIARVTAVAATTTATARRTRTVFARTRFVYIKGATVEVFAIHRAHGGISLRVVVHCDEREAARFAGDAIHHKTDFADGAVLFEQILEIVLGCLKGEITYVQFHLCLNMEKLPSYRAVPVNRVSNHQ